MTSKHLRLGRIAGIPISLDYSWFLIFILLTWSLAVSYFPAQFPGWTAWEYWSVGALSTILLFLSVLLHELGHASIAQHYHIPVREITLFIFGGVSQIQEEPKSAHSEFWIAIAGPIVSLLLGIIFWVLGIIFGSPTQLGAVCKYLGIINISLFLFNLIPGFPLDGGRVFRAIVWGATHNEDKATITAVMVGRFFAYVFIVIGVGIMFAGNLFDGLWLAFIGWFLESAAVAQMQQLKLRNILSKYTVQQVMSRSYTKLPANLTVETLMQEHILGTGRRSYIVLEHGTPIGMLTIHQLKNIPKEHWADRTLKDIMLPLDQAKTIGPDNDLWTVLSAMDSEGVNQLPVVQNGNVTGMISRENLVNFLQQLSSVPN